MAKIGQLSTCANQRKSAHLEANPPAVAQRTARRTFRFVFLNLVAVKTRHQSSLLKSRQ